jgi:hypothetical protein
MNDWADEPEVAEWFDHVLREMVPMLEQSAVALSLVPAGDGEYTHGDAKLWVELGASIMMDKPLLVVAFDDRELPAKLVEVADEVVRLPPGATAEEAAPLRNALARIAGKIGKGGGPW